MVLPAPNLDDRHFQDLVDDAKRLVQQRCPEWTDHNVSDPGVTLIEAFAQMVDQLIYRLNRVPDRNYIKFLELIGVELRPPAAARGKVTFWLSAPQPQTVVVRRETEVATPRTDVADPVVFSTIRDLDIVPCSFDRAGALGAGGEATDYTTALRAGGEFECFQSSPQPGDALLVGLSNAVPSCAVVIRMNCRVRGVGVRPDWPPLIWEAWTGSGWTACDLDRDDTGGMNKAGDVVLHVPENHETSILAQESGRVVALPVAGARGRAADLHPVPTDPVVVGLHHRRHRADGARPGDPRGGHRRLGRHSRATLSAAAQAGGALGGTRGAAGDRRDRCHRLDRHRTLRRTCPGRHVLPRRRIRRRGAARAGRPAGRRHPTAVRSRATQGSAPAAGGLPHRRRRPGATSRRARFGC